MFQQFDLFQIYFIYKIYSHVYKNDGSFFNQLLSRRFYLTGDVTSHSPFIQIFRSSHPEVFLEKGVLKICSKFTGEHPCRNVISIKLESKATLLKSHFGMGVLCKFATCFQNTISQEHVLVAASEILQFFVPEPFCCSH